MITNVIPKSWNHQDHFLQALDSPWYRSIGEVLSEIVYATTTHFRKKGFRAALMPITCQSISSPMGLGSDSLPVEVDLMGERTFLADSMQFLLEYLLRQEVKGVWYIMPTFRGEDPDERHLNQFFHLEAEIEGSFENVMECVEDLVREIVHHLFSQKLIEGPHIETFLALNQIPEITMDEALSLCFNFEATSKEILPGIHTLTKQGEQYLINHVFKGPVWVTHLPRMSVPFYQAFEKEIAYCADLLMGSGEVVGCGERITDSYLVIQSLRDHRVNWEDYDWYIKMKREKPLRTSGFGMGIERLLLWLFDHNDIRDIPIFPRLKGVFANP